MYLDHLDPQHGFFGIFYFNNCTQLGLLLKGQCHEIFNLCIFAQKTLSGPVVNRLVRFKKN